MVLKFHGPSRSESNTGDYREVEEKCENPFEFLVDAIDAVYPPILVLFSRFMYFIADQLNEHDLRFMQNPGRCEYERRKSHTGNDVGCGTGGPLYTHSTTYNSQGAKDKQEEPSQEASTSVLEEDVQHREGEENVDGTRSGRQSIDHLEMYLFAGKCPTLVFLGCLFDAIRSQTRTER